MQNRNLIAMPREQRIARDDGVSYVIVTWSE